MLNISDFLNSLTVKEKFSPLRDKKRTKVQILRLNYAVTVTQNQQIARLYLNLTNKGTY